MGGLFSNENRNTGGGPDAEERARMESEEAAQQEAEALPQQILSSVGGMRTLSIHDHAVPYRRSPSSSEEEDLSELSADLFDGLTEVQTSEEERGSVSSSDSCTSMQSDQSREEQPNFSIEARPSGSNTPEERTALHSLVNQLREERKALEEKTKALDEKTTALREEKRAFREEKGAFREEKRAFREEKRAFREEKRAFREEKRAKALDSLISLKYGKSLHLNSKEEDLPYFSSSPEDLGKEDGS